MEISIELPLALAIVPLIIRSVPGCTSEKEPSQRHSHSAKAPAEAAPDRPKPTCAPRERSSGVTDHRGAPKGARTMASSGRPKSRGAPKGTRTMAPSNQPKSRSAPKGAHKGALKGLPPRSGGDVRITQREDALVNALGVWACPICGLAHEEGEGVNAGTGVTRYTCDSCGDIAACRNTDCEGWLAIEYNPRCGLCNQLHRT